ncbi:MAG: DUF4961 domain-containing protein [Sphingobacteriales bacterium]|nr:MAG: DUF4961 domain-containing protein [Sphingobacteriales bacterium]
MRSYIHIKGAKLWMLCAVAVIGVVITCCTTKITSVQEPTNAVIGDIINVKLNVDFTQVINLDPPYPANYVVAILAPKGWKISENTAITYTSNKGNGKMRPMDPARLEPTQANNGLTWSQSLKAKFNIGGNLVDDVEWVAFESETQYPFANGDNLQAVVNIQMKVGADNNTTLTRLAYVVCESRDGILVGVGTTGVAYASYFGGCLTVGGGTTGDVLNFCDPQLVSVDPPKAVDNDLLTFKFDSNVQSTLLDGNDDVHLCISATVTDNASGAVSNIDVCDGSAKTKLKRISAGKYGLTIWPQGFFGLTETQNITRMSYFITNASGSIKVGYQNTAAPFTYKFKCE